MPAALWPSLHNLPCEGNQESGPVETLWIQQQLVNMKGDQHEGPQQAATNSSRAKNNDSFARKDAEWEPCLAGSTCATTREQCHAIQLTKLLYSNVQCEQGMTV